MSTAITVENLGKKYTISHQQREEYSSLRDAITNGVRSLSKKVFSPFTPSTSLRADLHPSPLSASEDFWALKDVSFEVKQGDRIGIIGRNGAGKSTLLKILSRITEPTTGSIRIKGRVASLLEVGTGFHPELTGRENIYLNGAILGMGRQEIRKKFDEIVDFAEIEKFLDTPVKRYSSGMYVRLAFAVAAHLEPEILIVDEVLAVGDAQFQKKCLGKMEEVSEKEGRTVLFVSHNIESVRKLCNKGIHIEDGHALFYSDFEECISSYLGSTVQKLQPIVSKCTKFSEKIEVNQILVNGYSDDAVTLLAGCQVLKVDVIGTVYSKTRVAFEGRIFESSGHAIAIFSPSHYYDKARYMDPGAFRIQCSIILPAFTKGVYYMSFFFTDPGVEGLLDFPKAVKLMAESETMTTTGGVLENCRGHGAIILSGSIDYEQGDL